MRLSLICTLDLSSSVTYPTISTSSKPLPITPLPPSPVLLLPSSAILPPLPSPPSPTPSAPLDANSPTPLTDNRTSSRFLAFSNMLNIFADPAADLASLSRSILALDLAFLSLFFPLYFSILLKSSPRHNDNPTSPPFPTPSTELTSSSSLSKSSPRPTTPKPSISPSLPSSTTTLSHNTTSPPSSRSSDNTCRAPARPDRPDRPESRNAQSSLFFLTPCCKLAILVEFALDLLPIAM